MGRNRKKSGAGSVEATRYDIFGNVIDEAPAAPTSASATPAQFGRSPDDVVGQSIVAQFRELFGGVPIGAETPNPTTRRNADPNSEIVRLMGADTLDEPVTYDVYGSDMTRTTRTERPLPTEFDTSAPTERDLEWGAGQVTITAADGTMRTMTRAESVIEAYARMTIFASMLKRYAKYSDQPGWRTGYQHASALAELANVLGRSIRPDGTINTWYLNAALSGYESNTRSGEVALDTLRQEMNNLATGISTYANRYYPSRQMYQATPARTKAQLAQDAKMVRRMSKEPLAIVRSLFSSTGQMYRDVYRFGGRR
jgi:hypothetical protein